MHTSLLDVFQYKQTSTDRLRGCKKLIRGKIRNRDISNESRSTINNDSGNQLVWRERLVNVRRMFNKLPSMAEEWWYGSQTKWQKYNSNLWNSYGYITFVSHQNSSVSKWSRRFGMTMPARIEQMTCPKH